MSNLTYLGELSLTDNKLIAFFSSRETPAYGEQYIDRWIAQLPQEGITIVCGGHSWTEKSVVKKLLYKGVPVVMLDYRLNAEEYYKKEYGVDFQNGRFCVLCYEGDFQEHETTGDLAFRRNLMIRDLCDEVVVGYATPGGNLDIQMSGCTNVRYLIRSNDNFILNKMFSNTRRGKVSYLFEILRDRAGEALRLVQCKSDETGNGSKYERIVIDKDDIQNFKYNVDRVLRYWDMDDEGYDKGVVQRKNLTYPNEPREWTAGDDEMLKLLVSQGVELPKMAWMLGRRECSVEMRMYKLGIKKESSNKSEEA